jgi:hypothetical protein
MSQKKAPTSIFIVEIPMGAKFLRTNQANSRFLNRIHFGSTPVVLFIDTTI